MTVLDANRISTLQGVSDTDGSTLVHVYANTSKHALFVDDAETGTDKGGNPDPRDANRKVAFFAVSSVDGVTPVAVYIDPITNKLLIQST